MIKPVGSDELQPLFVYDPDKHHELMKEAEGLPSVVISSQAAGNAVMMGGGYFSPLRGFMSVADAMGTCENMRMTSGAFFPVPVMCLLEDAAAISGATRIALRDPNMEGNPVLAIMDVEAVEEVTDEQMAFMTEKVYRTSDAEHPGVAAFNSQGRMAVSGPVQVLHFSYFQDDFPDTFRTAVEIRNEIAERGWDKVVAFQTRNPMHRAHEELCRMAMEDLGADGILIHMLLGQLKPGDIPADVRDAAIRKMVEVYFPKNTVMITGYGFDMLYAGPREAVLHAIFRQNMGATHLIVGRDHAGVGDYYGPFDAHHIFDTLWDDALYTRPLKIDITFFCYRCGGMATGKTCPHDAKDRLAISGTRLREMFAKREAIPAEFSRPEVVAVLQAYYDGLK